MHCVVSIDKKTFLHIVSSLPRHTIGYWLQKAKGMMGGGGGGGVRREVVIPSGVSFGHRWLVCDLALVTLSNSKCKDLRKETTYLVHSERAMQRLLSFKRYPPPPLPNTPLNLTHLQAAEPLCKEYAACAFKKMW